MIDCPAVWTLFPLVIAAFVLASWLVAKTGGLDNRVARAGAAAAGAIVGLFAFALPFFEQPVLHSAILNYAIGIPLAALGVVARVYPMMYLLRRRTTTTLDKVTTIVETGPYGIVRHPQYVGGLLMLAGWFLIWGALHCLCLLPLFALLTLAQASIEETYILEKEFGEEYRTYKERVGMFFPTLKRKEE
jgi:protein-S-isoprenylcysteine O-methyltransferase Ste14